MKNNVDLNELEKEAHKAVSKAIENLRRRQELGVEITPDRVQHAFSGMPYTLAFYARDLIYCR